MKNKIMWGIFALSEAGREYIHAAHYDKKCAKMMVDGKEKSKGYPKIKKVLVTEYIKERKDSGIVE